jgi:hypothetical protein
LSDQDNCAGECAVDFDTDCVTTSLSKLGVFGRGTR